MAQIQSDGGTAVANYDSVEHGERIVETALKAFGRIDVVINNAGILRDKTFKRMSDSDWAMIMKVHVEGVYRVTKAAWGAMMEQGFGRVVNVSSPAGLFGNVGQANYSLAKMGMVGFSQTLAKEGGRKGVFTNCIAPLAGTRMLLTAMPENIVNALKVEHIVSLVLFLCHESCEENGSVYECGGGVYQKVQIARAPGWTADLAAGDPTVEDIAAHIDEISDMSDAAVVDFEEGGSRDGIINVMAHAKASKL